MDAELSQPALPPERVEAWSKLARLIPFLLLYSLADPAIPASPAQPASVRKELTRRFRLAEEGKYGSLLDEGRLACQATLARRNAATTRPRPRPRSEVLAAACEKAEDGSLRSAAQLLIGDATLPPSHTTAAAVEKLYSLEPKAPLPQPKRGAVAQVPTRTIANRIHKLRGTAHPGPNGERNTHIRTLTQSPHGIHTLTRWTNMWLRPTLSTHFRQPWLSSGLVALDKGGGKPRPIVFQECLLKLATGSVVDYQASDLHGAAGKWQFGVYHPGGAIDLVWQLRAAMRSAPNDVFTTIDCRNAFGEVHRAAALRIADAACPSFARLLHNLWQGTHTPISIPNSPTTAHTIHVQDGLVQGGCEAAPAFALALHEAVAAFLDMTDRAGIPCRVWAYMDDMYLQCDRQHWHHLMTDLVARLAAVGLECRADKSHCFIPSLASPKPQPPTAPHTAEPSTHHAPTDTTATTPTVAAEFACYATLQMHGLPALGTAANGQFATLVSTIHPSGTEMETRLAKADRLCQALCEVIAAPLPTVRYHPVWRILDGVVNHCLSYDVAVSDPGTTVPYCQRLDTMVLSFVATLLDCPAPDPTLTALLRLDRASGGCGLRSAEDRSYTAYLASSFRLAHLHHSHDVPSIRSALAHLATLGVVLDPHGMPHPPCSPPPVQFDPSSHFLHHMPKRQRAWWHLLDTQRAQSLGSTHPDVARRLESCSGPEGGAFLRATRADGITSLPDRSFIVVIRLRLGLAVLSPGLCAHSTKPTKDGPPRQCVQQLDQHGLHACTCKVGGALYAGHGCGCNVLYHAIQQAGYQARREQVVPEFATPKLLSPQIDIDAWGLLGQPRLLADFTIRHPFAQRYEQQSPHAKAHDEKTTHYAPTQGLHVTPATMDTYGRHSPDLARLLEHLADLARLKESQSGLAPTRWLRRWRAQLSYVVSHMAARSVLSAAPEPALACGAKSLHACMSLPPS